MEVEGLVDQRPLHSLETKGGAAGRSNQSPVQYEPRPQLLLASLIETRTTGLRATRGLPRGAACFGVGRRYRRNARLQVVSVSTDISETERSQSRLVARSSAIYLLVAEQLAAVPTCTLCGPLSPSID